MPQSLPPKSGLEVGGQRQPRPRRRGGRRGKGAERSAERSGRAPSRGRGRGHERRAGGWGERGGRRASTAVRAHVTGPRGPARAVVWTSEDGGREGASSAGGREAHRL